MPSNAVEIRGLEFSYIGAGAKVLKGVSLAIKPGEFVGVIGGIGVGKTTLLETLNGIIPHLVKGEYSGGVEVFGKSVLASSVQEMSRSVAFVFQDPNDQLFLETVEKEASFALENRGGLSEKQIASRVKDALEEAGVGLLASRDPTTLSQGQKQKVALACAIAMDADLLVLDEPTSSLDHKSSIEIYSALRRLNREGKTIIASEHDAELLAEYAKRIVLINDGRVALDGGREILAHPLVERLGIKVPCAVEVSKSLGLPLAFTPGELASNLRAKLSKNTKPGRMR